jgi:sugar phosphate isomerase/epimerase
MKNAILERLTLAHLSIGAPPADTIDAAAASGFGAVGIRICARRPGEPFATPIVGARGAADVLRRRARDQGVRLSNVSAYQFYPEVDVVQMLPVIDALAEMQVPVVVANGFDAELPRFRDRFAQYCERAATVGVRVALEFLPYSAVRTLDAAMAIVRDSGASNAGLLLDALHLQRAGSRPDALRALPAERVIFAQLCDAPALPASADDESLLNEARHARLPAGTGGLPLHEFLDALPTGCEIEYEVARADLREHSPLEKAQAAAADALRFMRAHLARADAAKAG